MEIVYISYTKNSMDLVYVSNLQSHTKIVWKQYTFSILKKYENSVCLKFTKSY